MKDPHLTRFSSESPHNPQHKQASSFPFYHAVFHPRSRLNSVCLHEMGSLDEAPFNPTYNK